VTAAASAAASAVTRQGISVGIATGAYGISFGALSVAAGLDVWQTCALSLLMFTGGSQFAFVGVLGAGGSGLAAGATAGLLGARNALYSLQVAPLLDLQGLTLGGRLRRVAAAQLTIDESTAMATAQPGAPAKRYAFWVTGATVFVCWNVATLIGALAGSAIDPERYGLDAAFPAGFVAMVAPHLRHRQGLAAGAVAAVICLTLIPFTPVGVPILCAAAAVFIGVRRSDDPTELQPMAGALDAEIAAGGNSFLGPNQRDERDLGSAL